MYSLDDKLTEDDVARALRVSTAVLRSWRVRGKGPRFFRFGRAVRYLRADIEDYITESAAQPRTTPVPPSAA
jgi:predicted DNA-binding transcriptional regulator AlpA